MKRDKEPAAEIKCPACEGTGFQRIKQPVQPGRRILSRAVREMCGQGANCESMTGEQSRTLKVGDRVCWGDTTNDLGTVVGASWSEVTIAWDDGEANSVSHNDMAKVERVPNR